MKCSTRADSPSPGPWVEPLTPVVFLDRSADVHADRTAVVDGELRLTYAEFRNRCLRQAGLLASRGVTPGDRVAVLAPNNHVLLDSHFGVPYAGGVLVALNIRLSAAELSYIVEHCGAKTLVHDPAFAEQAATIARHLADAGTHLDLLAADDEYERLLARADTHRAATDDERGLIALNYTSGTTGRPKGVMYHHRGAYLQSLAMVSHFALNADTVYLWTLPMFHCNGWCFTWAVTAAGGTHVCLPRPEPDEAWRLLAAEGATTLCAAPTVLISLIEADAAAPLRGTPAHVAVGGAPPSPALLKRCAELGLAITHLYGLTESFGPAVICDWRSEWDALPVSEQAVLKARQGVPNVIGGQLRVLDRWGNDVPRDGSTLGEVVLRGNNVMLGYYRDEDATRAAIQDGWLRTGDLGVLHPDGYLELRDRAKDVIVSGGENISSIEVEAALAGHPAVLEAAVVAVPDARWGERPVAWVTLRRGAVATADELRAHVRTRLAGFKVPDRVEFGELPKTASGKIRKAELRRQAREGHSSAR
ncbi:AMP-binding protein [Streptomyces blattellae]|uniref:AMP-binding protein n=1 Tax=Streptomyces blattellae TaxID=2569855 RepID=UPI0012BA2480|nr:AMP-binding protein [Streptomyces blattellae]